MEYYTVLGLDPEAANSDQEIKSAYRKMAQRYHPDRAGSDVAATTRFLEITKAFEVLKDPSKRAAYDEGRGKAAAVPTTGAIAKKQPKRWFRAAPKKPEPTRIQVPLKLSEMILGSVKAVQFPRNEPCDACAGTGNHPRVPGPCGKCHGEGLALVLSGANLRIAAGARPGTELTFADLGAYAEPNGLPGDLIAVIALAAAAGIELDGDNVKQYLVLSLAQAQNGVELRVHLPNGTSQPLPLAPGVIPGSTYRIADGGLPGKSGTKGDYILKVGVWIPARGEEQGEVTAAERRKVIDILSGKNAPSQIVST